MSEIVQYDISKCVKCEQYDKPFIEAVAGQHFRVEIKPYLCPPCLDGTASSIDDIADWEGWER